MGGGSTVVSGRPFQVQVQDAPGMMLDYVAVFACRSLYDCDAGPDYDAAVYTYTGAIVDGVVEFRPVRVCFGAALLGRC